MISHSQQSRDLAPTGVLVLPSTGLTDALRKQSNISPAIVPPEFGITADWAHKDFLPGEYHARREQITSLLGRLNEIPAILINQFSAKVWCNTLSALFIAFGQTDKPFTSFADLEGTKADPSAMIAKGLFGSMPGTLYDESKLIQDYKLLRSMRLEDVLFKVRNYQALDKDQHTFVQQVENYLLLVNQVNEHRVSVKLVPSTPEGLLDHRYFNFYERLADFGVSGIFSITGKTSLYDLHLGRWDKKAIGSGDQALLPQYEKSILPQPPLPDLKTARVVQRSSFDGYDNICYGHLTLEVGEKVLRLERTQTGALWITKDGGKFPVSLPSNHATREFMQKLLNREVTRIHTDVEIDTNLLESYTHGPFYVDRSACDEKAIEEQRTQVIKKLNSDEVDADATVTYQRIVEQLSGGAMNIPDFAKNVQSIATQLTEDQVNFVSMGCMNYMASAIERGQLGDLEGLDKMFDVRGSPLPMDPAVADRIRLYAENLKDGVITKVLTSITSNGFVTPDVFNLELQSDRDAKHSRNPLLNAVTPLRQASRLDYFDDVGRPKDLTDFQPELTARLINYVQEKIPGIEVTPEVIYEIKRFGEVIQVVQGKRNDDFASMSNPVAIALTRTFEYNMGVELPKLRQGLPAGALEEYLALPPVTELAKPALMLKPQEVIKSVPEKSNRPLDPRISSLFEEASDADHEADYTTARQKIDELFKLAKEESLRAPQAAYFVRLRLDVREGKITNKNIKQKSGLTAAQIKEVRSTITSEDTIEDSRSLCYDNFQIHGFGGYMVTALALYQKSIAKK